ncbi:MAG: UvrD-helicase domain-containing protein [Paludibacteraceae bacterium]|nr:UvrD-helicase domain-containing protein [Paludibacteraceae bacterium]
MLTLYQASAGSGKTYTLAYEYIRLLLSNTQADKYRRILAVTFTKKATAEMKERILKELHVLSTDPAKSPYTGQLAGQLNLSAAEIQQRAGRCLHAILQDYTRFAVLTIDSFFQQVVRSFAREVGLSAQYTIELDSKAVVNQAVDDLLFAMNHRRAAEDVGSWLNEFALDNVENLRSWNPRETMKTLSRQLFSEQLQARLDQLRTMLTDKQALRDYRLALEAVPADDKTGRATADAILQHLNALGLLSDVWEQISITNREQKRLPIEQINSLLQRIIDDADSPFIYEKMGTRIHHYMIDEFQDTSAMQWHNFRPLVTESVSNGNDNLIVGDIKQSIYRFRNSDWHQLQHVAEQFPGCNQPLMDTNYRSARAIVETNNDLFDRYVKWVADTLSKDKKLRTGLGGEVEKAYATLRQKVHKQELGGYVRLRWFKSESADEVCCQAEEEILQLLPKLRERGYRMGQVAMLVRYGKEASRIANLLLANGYEVQSQEGLLVASHPAVQVLVLLLMLTVAPHDEVARTRLRHVFAEQRYPDNPTQATRFTLGNEPYLTAEQEEAIRQAQLLPLYEQVQQLIAGLQLYEWPHAAAYLTAFQDIIFAYSEHQTAEIGTFLQYWEDKQLNACICSAPTDEAIRVMTIHKSKGLEFDVVVIPYMSWDLGPSKMDAGKILWCKPDIAPFDQMPLVPVGFKKELQKTYFSDAYSEEYLNFYIDNLNLTYVAFTRPVRELYAFGQTTKEGKNGTLSPKNIGQLFYSLLQEASGFRDNCFTRGEAEPYQAGSKSTSDVTTLQAVYHATPIGTRLRLSTRGIQDELSLQDFGTLMHDWLSRITTLDEAEARLQELLREGRAREQDIPRMRQEWQHFLQLIAGRDWFDERYQVLSEHAILTATGQTLRPDRVMIDGRRAVVIDYKFGTHLAPSHRDQVRDYMTQLSQMGYSVEGYLVYVTLSQIVAL